MKFNFGLKLVIRTKKIRLDLRNIIYGVFKRRFDFLCLRFKFNALYRNFFWCMYGSMFLEL